MPKIAAKYAGVENSHTMTRGSISSHLVMQGYPLVRMAGKVPEKDDGLSIHLAFVIRCQSDRSAGLLDGPGFPDIDTSAMILWNSRNAMAMLAGISSRPLRSP
jgi:hypothetical protein